MGSKYLKSSKNPFTIRFLIGPTVSCLLPHQSAWCGWRIHFAVFHHHNSERRHSGGGAAARRRQPEAAAAAPCMASYIAVHRKTLCSPIFVLFSSHIIIFRWQALQFGFVPSQPSCQSRILYATNTTNQPFAYSPQRPVWEFNSWWFWAIRVWPRRL